MPHENKITKPKVVLVGLHLPNVTLEDHQSSLKELARLAHTLGFEVLATISQRRHAAVTGTIIGEGKLKELARLTGGTGKVASQAPLAKRKHQDLEEEEEENNKREAKRYAQELLDEEDVTTEHIDEKADKVIFDDELSPTQLRNLESATGVEVLDRTGVIIEIFHRHARTREARIQVEIARLRYLAPRLRMNRVGQDRQSGGIGAKGVGETAHELDKRRIRDRISELSHELTDIHKNQVERRQRRSDQLKVALVGYTNAGKSSLMRALTGSQVLVEDKLFATLDTTVRAMYPETHPRILISDTVGFIKKLPHDLVASFRSTLDEAADASLLLYIVDAADPTFRAQLEVTRSVLSELDLASTESLLVLNKADCLEAETIADLLREFPGALSLSTQNKSDVQELRELIIAHFEKDMIERDFFVPYDRGELLGDIHSTMRVLEQTHDDNGTVLKVRAFPEVIESFVRRLS